MGRLQNKQNVSGLQGRKMRVAELERMVKFDHEQLINVDPTMERIYRLQLAEKELDELKNGTPTFTTTMPIGPAPQVRDLFSELPALLVKISTDLKIENAKEKLREFGAASL